MRRLSPAAQRRGTGGRSRLWGGGCQGAISSGAGGQSHHQCQQTCRQERSRNLRQQSLAWSRSRGFNRQPRCLASYESPGMHCGH
jgi:hypothetical protein